MMLTMYAALALIVVLGTATIHYESIRRLDRFARRAAGPYPTLLVVIIGLIALHLLEIGAYAGIFFLSAGPLGAGSFKGVPPHSPMAYFYYAAEAYASLGYGDAYPTGDLRLISSVAPLNGILLLTWSGSFLFSLVEDWRSRENHRIIDLRASGSKRTVTSRPSSGGQ